MAELIKGTLQVKHRRAPKNHEYIPAQLTVALYDSNDHLVNTHGWEVDGLNFTPVCLPIRGGVTKADGDFYSEVVQLFSLEDVMIEQ